MIVLADIFLIGIARGNPVVGHKMVRRYSLCLPVFGRGPTQSMIIFSNGVLGTVIGTSGATGIFSLGLPVTWHA